LSNGKAKENSSTTISNKMTSKLVKKTLNSPDEIISSVKEKIELVNLDGFNIARVTLEPGWSWDKYVKPIEKTNSCQVAHTSLILSGRARTIMDDGTVYDSGPGDVGIVPPGHNSMVIGDEPCIMIDFSGIEEYIKGRRS
jgi:quercetin dioxygenase-like cupin family protein